MQKIHSFTTFTHLSRFTETTYKISHDSNIKCVSHFTISAVLPGGLGVGVGHPSLLGPVSSVSQPPRLAWFLFFTLPLVFGTLMHFRSFLFFSQSTADFLGNQNSLFPQCQFGGDPDKVNFDLLGRLSLVRCSMGSILHPQDQGRMLAAVCLSS